MAKKQSEIRNTFNMLITQFTSILNKNWEEDQVSIFLILYQNTEDLIPNNDGQDFLDILAATIHKANVENLSDFFTISHLNVKEPKTYKQAMNKPNV